MAESGNPSWLRRAGAYLGFRGAPAQTSLGVGEGTVGAEFRAAPAPTAPARPSLSTITVDTALGIGAVYRAVSVIVGSVTAMELAVFRGEKEITAPALVRQPNVNDTSDAFIEETVWSLATYGNAYWRLYGDPVTSMKVLDPNTVSAVMDLDTGRVDYYIDGRQVKPSQIKHLKLMRKPGSALGLGPIQAAKDELTGALRLRQFADNWFDTAEVPTGVLETDLVLSPQESAQFSEAWRKFIKEHGVPVLSQGLKYKPIHLKPAEAQFLEAQQASVVSIARLFGVPSMHLLAEVTGTSNTYVNQQELNLIFLQTTLSRYMREIETAFSSLLPGRAVVKFKEEGLLRLDSRALWEMRKTQHEIGARTVNEIRALDGFDPLPEPAAGTEGGTA